MERHKNVQSLAGKLSKNIQNISGFLSASVYSLRDPTIIVRHINKCGIGTELKNANNSLETFEKILKNLKLGEITGAIICTNSVIGSMLAHAIVKKLSASIVVAPGYTDAALKIFDHTNRLRIIELAPPSTNNTDTTKTTEKIKHFAKENELTLHFTQ